MKTKHRPTGSTTENNAINRKNRKSKYFSKSKLFFILTVTAFTSCQVKFGRRLDVWHVFKVIYKLCFIKCSFKKYNSRIGV